MPDCSVVVVMARLGQIKQHSLNQLHEWAVFSEKATWSHWFSIAMFICTFFAIWIPIRFEILKTQFIWTLHTEIWFTYSFICALRVFLKKIKLLLKSVRFFFSYWSDYLRSTTCLSIQSRISFRLSSAGSTEVFTLTLFSPIKPSIQLLTHYLVGDLWWKLWSRNGYKHKKKIQSLVTLSDYFLLSVWTPFKFQLL